MKTYRYGRFENILGSILYVIQRKTWVGWITIHEFGNKETMLDVARQLKDRGCIMINVNIK